MIRNHPGCLGLEAGFVGNVSGKSLRVGIRKAYASELVLLRKNCSLGSPDSNIDPMKLIFEYVGYLGSLPTW